jgi:hypothetical protein
VRMSGSGPTWTLGYGRCRAVCVACHPPLVRERAREAVAPLEAAYRKKSPKKIPIVADVSPPIPPAVASAWDSAAVST